MTTKTRCSMFKWVYARKTTQKSTSIKKKEVVTIIRSIIPSLTNEDAERLYCCMRLSFFEHLCAEKRLIIKGLGGIGFAFSFVRKGATKLNKSRQLYNAIRDGEVTLDGWDKIEDADVMAAPIIYDSNQTRRRRGLTGIKICHNLEKLIASLPKAFRDGKFSIGKSKSFAPASDVDPFI